MEISTPNKAGTSAAKRYIFWLLPALSILGKFTIILKPAIKGRFGGEIPLPSYPHLEQFTTGEFGREIGPTEPLKISFAAKQHKGRMSTSRGSAFARPLSLWWSTMECSRALLIPCQAGKKLQRISKKIGWNLPKKRGGVSILPYKRLGTPP